MVVCCHSLKTAFFIPEFPDICYFKLFLFDLDSANHTTTRRRRPRARHINRHKDYRSRPFAEAVAATPQGYRRVAVVMDPAELALQVWRKMVSKKSFERRAELPAIEAAGLAVAPVFSEFIKHLLAYSAASPAIARALDCMACALGADLSDYDAVLRVDRTDQLAAFFATDDPGIATATIVPDLPSILSPKTLADMETLLAQQYALIGTSQQYYPHVPISMQHSRLSAASTACKNDTLVISRGAPSQGGLHVVCMLKETPEVVVRFVDYYSALGCESINLYFDDPNDIAFDLIAKRPRVVATRCDEAYWKGKRKKTVEGRQSRCYDHCYAKLSAPDWLIVCDADEFVTALNGSVPDLLDSAAAEQRVVRFRSAEAVWETDTCDFEPFTAPYVRTQVRESVWRELKLKKPGHIQQLFSRGLLAHRSGKFAVRAGLDVKRVSIHRVMFADGYNSMRLPAGSVAGLLVHFDAISLRHWQRKSENRTRPDHGIRILDKYRTGQVDAYIDSDDADRVALFRALYAIDPEETEILASVGALYRIAIFDDLPDLAPRSPPPEEGVII